MKRKIPVVERIDVEQVSSCYQRKKLVINGVSWSLEQDRYQKLKITEYFDLKNVLKIPADVCRVHLEDAVIGTSFVSVRIVKTWKHKGHVVWYDLNTLEKVSKTDVMKAR